MPHHPPLFIVPFLFFRKRRSVSTVNSALNFYALQTLFSAGPSPLSGALPALHPHTDFPTASQFLRSYRLRVPVPPVSILSSNLSSLEHPERVPKNSLSRIRFTDYSSEEQNVDISKKRREERSSSRLRGGLNNVYRRVETLRLRAPDTYSLD